jgi:hypothetical protein
MSTFGPLRHFARRNNSVAFRAKQTFKELRLENRIYDQPPDAQSKKATRPVGEGRAGLVDRRGGMEGAGADRK